jgi:hypothetical protein
VVNAEYRTNGKHVGVTGKRATRSGSARDGIRGPTAIDEIALVAGRGDRIDQLGSHLVAARADARPDRGDEIGRLAAELALEYVERRDCSTCGSTAPTCVHRSHDAAVTIGHEQRYTVSDTNRHSYIAAARYESIGLRHCGRRTIAIAHHDDRSPMNLLCHRDCARAH